MVKNIGKPCAGKPHARFDEGGLASQLWCGYLGTARRKGRKQTSQPKAVIASSLLYPEFELCYFTEKLRPRRAQRNRKQNEEEMRIPLGRGMDGFFGERRISRHFP